MLFVALGLSWLIENLSGAEIHDAGTHMTLFSNQFSIAVHLVMAKTRIPGTITYIFEFMLPFLFFDWFVLLDGINEQYDIGNMETWL